MSIPKTFMSVCTKICINITVQGMDMNHTLMAI